MNPKTSTLSLFKRSFRLALTNIWRNKVLSAATIFVTATIIFIFNIILAINFIAQGAIADLNKKIDITVYLKENIEYEQVRNLLKDISTQEGVFEASYTSKQDALNQIKTTHPDISLAFEKYRLGNPLPASINITTTHPKYHQNIANFLAQETYQQYLSTIITNNNSDTSNSVSSDTPSDTPSDTSSDTPTSTSTIITSVSKNLLELTNFTHQIIFWLILIFILGGALIILNALQITIFSRKNEISVMKLVGASNWFIKSPFIIESIIYGFLAVILSFIMLLILSTNIKIEGSSLWSYYKGIDFYIIFLVEIAATGVLCILSSSIAIHEYIKQDLLED